jgi:hypothetical protein
MEGAACDYQGQGAWRPHLAVWAEAGWVLAADFGSGGSDPRSQAPAFLARALSALPGGLARPIVAADSGVFDAKLATAALGLGCDYVPNGWPSGARTICRRVRAAREELPGDSRSRRRRTIEANRRALLSSGEADHVYAYSPIITNLAGDFCDSEAWLRQRALVEEKISDSKLGLALRHMPSGYEAVNVMWTWAALVGLNISS